MESTLQEFAETELASTYQEVLLVLAILDLLFHL